MTASDISLVRSIELIKTKSQIYTQRYGPECCRPIKIDFRSHELAKRNGEIIRSYHDNGFCIVEFTQGTAGEDCLLRFSKLMNLGPTYVPAQYRDTAVYSLRGFNVIAKDQNKGIFSQHRGFYTDQAQSIHSDGTLEEIGKVKTSLFLCILPAAKGGESIIFNSVAAFVHMVDNSSAIACSLTNPIALERCAVNGNLSSVKGPAFSVAEGELISRFSMDNTCNWEISFGTISHLKEAVTFLSNLCNQGSGFYIEVPLLKNQALILANDKISHGRREYLDSENHKRTLIRGLFTTRPK